MTSFPPSLERQAASGDLPPPPSISRECLSLLVVAVWAGLVAGFLEVATIIIHKRFFDTNHLYGLSRHFIWLIPLANVLIFLSMAIVLALLALARRDPTIWFARRWLCALLLMPVFLVAFPRVYACAWLFVCFGFAVRVVPAIERHARQFRQLVRFSLPLLVILVLSLAASTWYADRRAIAREHARPVPPEGSPNILLIVLDTVTADHLSLHGYKRQTSPTLTELSEKAIRFTRAQSSSSWTLPSHASIFTGRWPHELSVGWLHPLDDQHPTLAQHLSSSGYSTAGFVGNNLYCAADSGLGRGFATYRDFIFPRLTALKGASLLDRSLEVLQSAESWLETVDIDLFRAPVNTLVWLTTGNRKSAQDVNRELLEWIQNRAEPNRPFFAFANYYDAHYPYQLPGNAIHRFGAAPRESRENLLIQSWWPLDKSSVTQAELGFVVNSYDDCVAALDERLGFLFDRLSRQGVLENTWLVITADHGESFGEHPGVFCHGTSLYQTELHVPLLIIPPGGAKTPSVIDDTVSLRDLAATIVDLTGVSAAGAFPGDSLARFWKEDTPLERPAASIASSAIAEVVPNDPAIVKTREELLAPHWPLAALSERDWTYIRRDGEIDEQLFHRREDPGELRNLSTDPASQPRLEQMRGKLRELTAGPLTPDRFNR